MNSPRRNLPLNALRAFAAASRHRSFASAANQLGVSQVAVSRQIATLEHYLRAQLFERGPRSVRLTETGRQFSREIAPLFDAIEESVDALSRSEGEATVTVRIYPSFAHHWLLPRIDAFCQVHPDIDLRLDTRVEPLDFRGMQIDCALQLGDGDWREAESRRLFDEEIDAVCSPAYAERFGQFAQPEQLAQARALHARYRRREWNQWADSAGLTVEPGRNTDFQSSLLAYSAAMHGMGIAVGQLTLLASELRAGRLVRPFNHALRTESAFWAVWPTARSVKPATRRFIDWVLDECKQAREFDRSGRRASS